MTDKPPSPDFEARLAKWKEDNRPFDRELEKGRAIVQSRLLRKANRLN